MKEKKSVLIDDVYLFVTTKELHKKNKPERKEKENKKKTNLKLTEKQTVTL